jgi:signal transduction histidine kinase
MNALGAVSLVLAGTWGAAALTTRRAGYGRLAAYCALVAAVQLAAALTGAAVPLVVSAWVTFFLAVPDGRFGSTWRRMLVAATWAGAAAWVLAVGLGGWAPSAGWALLAVAIAAAIAAIFVAMRCGQASPPERRGLQWLAAAAVVVLTLDGLVLALHVLIGSPGSPREWLVAAFVAVPLGQVMASGPRTARAAEAALVESIVVAGMTGLVIVVYLVVVVGLGRAPVGEERHVLTSSIVAALVVAILALPVRDRLARMGRSLVGRGDASPDQVASTFGARMSRAVPMDELMLQVVESLRATVADGGAEIWVGNEGVLTRTVSLPSRGPARIELAERDRIVVARARIGGPAWCSVWLPAVLEERADGDQGGDLRVAPVTHLGQLLGLIVARRRPDSAEFGEDDERMLVDLARQLGLALHNLRLDSALQASLEELEQRNAELQASRLRIVTASDESRRAIERNLHDGAQQHLVALAVKLGLAEELAESEPDVVVALLRELRADVQTTIGELRELAHGIYPPLLRDRGLAEALRTAANRSPLPCTVEVQVPHRFRPEVETAVYFSCVEGLQNAAKYAGAGAQVTLRVWLATEARGEVLHFEVSDDGAGFEGPVSEGHGFVNMRDRLGAIGGTLIVGSKPGSGTRIQGAIPIPAAEPAPGSSEPAVAPSDSGDPAGSAGSSNGAAATLDATTGQAHRDEIAAP